MCEGNMPILHVNASCPLIATKSKSLSLSPQPAHWHPHMQNPQNALPTFVTRTTVINRAPWHHRFFPVPQPFCPQKSSSLQAGPHSEGNRASPLMGTALCVCKAKPHSQDIKEVSKGHREWQKLRVATAEGHPAI